MGPVGMTVEARPLQDFFHRGRGLESFAFGRVRAFDGHDLKGKEEDQQAERDSSQVHAGEE